MAVNDTIAALATPPGIGGIGLIRISGPRSEEIARRLFKAGYGSASFRSHHLHHGEIIAPATGAVIDEVLLAIMRSPRSYTGEDVVEISCHGGSVIAESILREIFKCGARLAEPGEFTRRAFLNNRIDLAQAEAVLDLIVARTDKARELALSQLTGELSRKIEDLGIRIKDILAALEAAIDFSEDDEAPVLRPAEDLLRTTIDELQALLATFETGKLYRHGIRVVIAGKPNVGKSSLLNRLLGERRAIVTPLPGTTRDFIEETLPINGIPCTLTDTAGIRPPEDVIEQEGIDMVRERLSLADLVILVLDGSAELTAEDRTVIETAGTKKTILVLNKADLPPRLGIPELHALLPGATPLWISAKYGTGIPALKAAIHDRARDQTDDHAPTVYLTNLRHKTALEKTAGLLKQAKEALARDLPPELVALDVREALESLEEVTGRTTSEEILDRIFSSFCIGK